MKTNLSNFYAGDSLSFYVQTKEYDGSYTATVIFVKDGKKQQFVGVYTDTQFNFEIDSVASQAFTDGFYQVYILFQNRGFQKTEMLINMNILPNILNSKCIETTTYNRKMLNAIENLLLGRMEDDYESYTIGNRSITKMTPDSLLKLRDYFAEKVNLEEQSLNGTNKGNKLKIRWIGRYNDGYGNS